MARAAPATASTRAVARTFSNRASTIGRPIKVSAQRTPETSAKFKASTTKLAAQYNAFCPIQGTCVNGNLTMGENLGDLGGDRKSTRLNSSHT